MPGFEVWDVIKVAFPNTNRPVQQRRPALIVAHHAAAGMPWLLWVLMITSAAHRRWAGDVEISDLAEEAGRLPMADRIAVLRCLSAALRDADG